MTKINEVIVIGAGGTGSILLPQLARFLYSQNFQGILRIVDGDTYSESNIDRQQFAFSYVGTNKAEYQAMAIASQLPGFKNNIEFDDKYYAQEDFVAAIKPGVIIITCADNNAVRKFVEDLVRQTPNSIHICCGNELSRGQVQLSTIEFQGLYTPSIYERSPNFQNGSGDRSKMSCEELAELPSGGQLIGANMTAATLALNFVMSVFLYPNSIKSYAVDYSIINNKFETTQLERVLTL